MKGRSDVKGEGCVGRRLHCSKLKNLKNIKKPQMYYVCIIDLGNCLRWYQGHKKKEEKKTFYSMN